MVELKTEELTDVQKYHINHDCTMSISDTGKGCIILFSDINECYCDYDEASNLLVITDMETNNPALPKVYELKVSKQQIRPLVSLYSSIIRSRFNLSQNLVFFFDSKDRLISQNDKSSYGFSKIKLVKEEKAAQKKLARYMAYTMGYEPFRKEFEDEQSLKNDKVIQDFINSEGFLFFSDFLGGKLV